MTRRVCGRCGVAPQRRSGRYCLACHRAYMRAYRPRHRDLPDLARRRANCRAYANVYRRRGFLVPQRCEVCGSPDVEMHHDDYDRPLAVRWRCTEHHLDLTRAARVNLV